MNRSRLFLISGIAMALLALLIAGCPNPMDAPGIYAVQKGGAGPGVTTFATGDLIAGRSMKAGTVEVENDSVNLYVTYRLEGGWVMTESHLAVALSLGGIPQTRTGNPIPGQFRWKMPHDPPEAVFTYTIGLGELEIKAGDLLYLAAHAEVRLIDETGAVIRAESAWAAGIQFPGKNWATYFTYQPVTGHSVFYDANSATGGSVPVDSARYLPGQTVTVLGNTGNLVREEYDFAGWNTQVDGSGTTYTAGQTFLMGSVDVTLYALWTQPALDLTGYWDITIQGYPAMLLYINQVDTDLHANLPGAGYLDGGVAGFNFTLSGTLAGTDVTFDGDVSDSGITGKVNEMVPFTMTPSTRHFGHLEIYGSYITPDYTTTFDINTDYALAQFDLYGSPLFVTFFDDTQSLGLFFNAMSGGFVAGDNPVHLDFILSHKDAPPEGGETPSEGILDAATVSSTGISGTFNIVFTDGGSSVWGELDLTY